MTWHKKTRILIAIFTALFVIFPAGGSLLAGENSSANNEQENDEAKEPPAITINMDGLVIPSDVAPVIESGRVLVPMRLLFEALGANVTWDNARRVVDAQWQDTRLALPVDTREAYINQSPVALDVPARILEGRTMVPLRFVAESLGLDVHWGAAERTVYLRTDLLRYYKLEKVPEEPKPVDPEPERSLEDDTQLPQEPSAQETQNDDASQTVNDGYISKIEAHVVQLSSSLKPRVKLAGDQVGRTATLANMADEAGGTVAITGTYYNYLNQNPDPYGTIITGGEPVHLGSDGTTALFHEDGSLSFSQVKPSLRGTINGSSDPGWLAFGINHTTNPERASTYVYTPARGTRIGFAHGTSVAVSGGRVTGIYENEDVSIPADGFVINFTDWHQNYANDFNVGDEVDYTITYLDRSMNLPLDLGTVEEALSCWPMLITGGEITAWPGTSRAARTALVQRGSSIYLAAAPAATAHEFASLLLDYLGADNALNLDGGGSAGLYLYGQYVMQPGRRISNSLVFAR